MVDFSALPLDDDTIAFWHDVRAFMSEHLTDEVREHEHRTGDGHHSGLHRALGTRGWVAPRWPVHEGGAALDAVRAEIIERELVAGGAVNIGRGTSMLPVMAIRAYASPELQAEVIPRVASGDATICLGYTEPDTGSDLAGVRTRAVRDGDEWVISGQKMFTTGAQHCAYSFLLARTNPDAAKHKGLTMFLVPLDRPGVEIQAIHTLGGERTNFVYYDDVRIPDHYRLGPVDEGWTTLSAPLNAEHGVGRTGDELGDHVHPFGWVNTFIDIHDRAVDWARETIDDDGRPMLDDPVVRERLARAALDIEVSLVTPGPQGRNISADLFIRDAADLLDLLGPAGIVRRGEDGALIDGLAEYGHRYAQGTATYGGTTDIHRNIIAERFLGLPRHQPRR